MSSSKAKQDAELKKQLELKDLQESLLKSSTICATCLKSLRDVVSDTNPLPEPSSSTAPTLALLLNDFKSLALLLKSHVTQLSLALGKPPVTASAGMPSLQKIREDVGRFTSCARMFDTDRDGISIYKEIRYLSEEIVEAIERCVKGFEQSIFGPPDLSKLSLSQGATAPYLFNLSILYSLVDSTATSSFPDSNLKSLTKTWKSTQAGFEDAVGEAEDLMKDEDDGDSDDGGWAEEFGEEGDDTGNITADEKERVKKHHTLLRFTLSLHKHIFSNQLKSSLLTVSSQNHLSTLSASLLSSIDELVSSFYSPQDLEAVGRFRKAAVEAGIELAEAVGKDEVASEKEVKWFDMWVKQVRQLDEKLATETM